MKDLSSKNSFQFFLFQEKFPPDILLVFFGIRIIHQHPDRRRFGIIVLTGPDGPDKSDKEPPGNQYAEQDKDHNDRHDQRFRTLAIKLTMKVEKATTVMLLAGMSIAATRGESRPVTAKPSPMML